MAKPQVKMLRKLLYWMEERQRIYLKRQAGEPFPWTEDPILQHYKFCCTYREQDRVTRWIRENWREPFALDKNLWFAMALARHINWPDSLEAVGYPKRWCPDKVVMALRKRRQAGQKVYTSAYLLGQARECQDRPEYTVYRVLDPLFQATRRERPPWCSACKLKTAVEYLSSFYGFGSFLAYEVVTDLRHTWYLRSAHDIMSWANIGPGARRGLNRLYGRNLRQSGTQSDLLDQLLTVMDWVVANRNADILPTIEPRDIEHSCCEMDKYIRTQDCPRNGLEIFRNSLIG